MISQQEIEWYQQIMPDLGVVFDVGCRNDNVFYDLNPDLELHLFDPKTPNKKMYGRYNNIALSDRRGTADFYPEYSSISRRDFIGKKWDWVKHYTHKIETDTLDNYCTENGIKKIDLLKIDTEGHDYQVLLGAVNMLPNIKFIQFEHWDYESTDKIKALLSDYIIEPLGGKPLNYKCKKC